MTSGISTRTSKIRHLANVFSSMCFSEKNQDAQ
jgi:hypothetical protein